VRASWTAPGNEKAVRECPELKECDSEAFIIFKQENKKATGKGMTKKKQEKRKKEQVS
jgi:hypothetical protein